MAQRQLEVLALETVEVMGNNYTNYIYIYLFIYLFLYIDISRYGYVELYRDIVKLIYIYICVCVELNRDID